MTFRPELITEAEAIGWTALTVDDDWLILTREDYAVHITWHENAGTFDRHVKSAALRRRIGGQGIVSARPGHAKATADILSWLGLTERAHQLAMAARAERRATRAGSAAV